MYGYPQDSPLDHGKPREACPTHVVNGRPAVQQDLHFYQNDQVPRIWQQNWSHMAHLECVPSHPLLLAVMISLPIISYNEIIVRTPPVIGRYQGIALGNGMGFKDLPAPEWMFDLCQCLCSTFCLHASSSTY